MRQNLVTQFVQLLKHWLCDMQSGVVVENNWALSVDQRWLQVLQFTAHPNLLSILLDVIVSPGFRKVWWIRWAADPQTVTMNISLVQVWFWKVLRIFFLIQPLSWSLLVVVYNPLFNACHNLIEKWFAVS